jgi:Siphovirus-type tail component, C-terminal domain
VGPLEAPAAGYQQIVRWAIALEAPDPRVYAALWKSLTLDPAGTAAGGLDFALTWALSFAGASGGDLAGIYVGGSVPTPPVLTFHGPGRVDQFANDTTGEAIVLVPVTLATGDVLVADCQAKTLTLNGFQRPDLVQPIGTTWWLLQPGENQLRLLGSGFVSGTSTLQVDYREARV